MATITTIAVVDHHRKNDAVAKAEVAAWYCEHRMSRCDQKKPSPIEAAWNRRERGYKAADVTLLVAGVGVVALVLWRT